MENELPDPIDPSISEVQDIKFERPPSSGSIAEAENVTEEPSIETKLSAGSVIDNVGDPITLMVIVIDCETVLPSESETVAVIVCVPTESVDIDHESPTPIGPSISEVQDIKFERPPSSGSVAEAENVTEEPSIETKLSTGSEIDNVGAPITLTVIVRE